LAHGLGYQAALRYRGYDPYSSFPYRLEILAVAITRPTQCFDRPARSLRTTHAIHRIKEYSTIGNI